MGPFVDMTITSVRAVASSGGGARMRERVEMMRFTRDSARMTMMMSRGCAFVVIIYPFDREYRVRKGVSESRWVRIGGSLPVI